MKKLTRRYAVTLVILQCQRSRSNPEGFFVANVLIALGMYWLPMEAALVL